MTTVAEKLHKWSLQELNLVSEGNLSKIPNAEAFQVLTRGRNKKIWNYVINHVRSKASADKVRRTLALKKKLKEQEVAAVSFVDNAFSPDHEKLKESLLKANEKRKYLLRSLSTIEERILNLDLSIQKIKDDVFQINQKTALLELLKKVYEEKISSLKNLFSQISSYQCALDAYQTSKTFDKLILGFSYDFLLENKAVYDENLSKMKDLVVISSSILKKQFNQDEDNMIILKENFINNFSELKGHDFLLIDLVMLLKEISKSDLQQLTSINSQNISIKKFLFEKSKESQANNHFVRLKCDYVYNSLNAAKSKHKFKKCLSMKSKASKNVMEMLKIDPSDVNYETKCLLIEKQIENDALIISNSYFENYLENIASKTETILKNIRQKNMHSKDVNCIIHTFYKNADFTFNLLYAAPSAIEKVNIYLKDIKLFVSKELFKLSLPEESSVTELIECFSSEKKLTWDYCAKTRLIEPLFAGSSVDKELPVEIFQSLNIKPYQNISVLCENWACFKQKLYSEIAANTKTCVVHNDINASEVYQNILKKLEKIKFSIEKSMSSLSYGTTCCQKNKLLVNEWWNQTAQYIPHIEYEGKTLKMWIDILSVLSDFELQTHT